MIVQLNKDLLYRTFEVKSFLDLDDKTQALAPSMVEYYLSDLSTSSTDGAYINKSNIQKTISLNEYSLYLDYSEDIYLEFEQKEDIYETESLW